MRRTDTSGSSYYEQSLLENRRDPPVRDVAPNEYSHVNPLLPNGEETPLTLGDYLGPNRGDQNIGSSPGSQNPGRYNPNTEGVFNSWSGGNTNPLRDNSGRNSNSQNPASETRTDGDDPKQEINPDDEVLLTWEELMRTNATSPGRSGRCDGIGPENHCQPPPGIEIVETRTQQEMEADLWNITDR